MDNLEYLRDHVLSLGRELRAKRSAMGLVDMDGLAKTAQKLVKCLNEKETILGLPRITRILRHRAGASVWGISPAAKHPDIESTIEWLDQVVENVESELDAVDKKRIMWLTVFSALISALALLVAIITVAVSVFAHK